MAPPSKRKQPAPRRLEERKRLHEAVDRIVDGPGTGDPDLWVRQVLVDLGFIFRAAAPAIDYEVGRVIVEVDRPLGHFPSNQSWQGAGLSVSAQQVNEWRAAGKAARGDRPPRAITQQRALAALLRPLASISCHSWL